jgi:hypothetical protein
MNIQREIVVKSKGLLANTVMLLGIAFVALLIYSSYASPSMPENVSFGILSILSSSLLGGLVALNLIVFSVIAKETYPVIARTAPTIFFIVTFGSLIFLTLSDRYRFGVRSVTIYLIFCLIVSILLNIIVYYNNKKSR